MGWLDKIGSVVVGTVLSPVIVPIAIASVVKDEMSKTKTCRWCSEEVYRDGLCRDCYEEEREEEREEQRREKEREAQRSNRRQIESEIESFKMTSKKQIENKYNITIAFDNRNVSYSSGDGKIGHLKEHISQLKAENSEIQNLVNDLQREKDAI